MLEGSQGGASLKLFASHFVRYRFATVLSLRLYPPEDDPNVSGRCLSLTLSLFGLTISMGSGLSSALGSGSGSGSFRFVQVRVQVLTTVSELNLKFTKPGACCSRFYVNINAVYP